MPHLFCEQTGKAANDPLFLKKRGAVTVAAAQKGEFQQQQQQPQQILAHGPIIVGAGPSGLAVAACLKEKGVPSIILERADCIASLWQRRSYDRLRLHLPKRFCELPLHPFPKEFPEYPDKNQFIAYLESYARRFHLRPCFNECVQSASYNRALRMWRVRTVATGPDGSELVKEYLGKWLVVATGENAEAIEPGFPGADRFTGNIMHACSYRNGHRFRDQNVLVVGCGNSGMEMCLDLSLYNANPSVVVRDSVHVLPRSILGLSTFGIAMCLLRWLPVRFVDRMLLLAARLLLGDTSRHGLPRPAMGPLELKNRLGRTPVLDVGTWELIRAGRIKVFPAVECLTPHGARFVDGQERDFDTVILATGYRTNVLSWLQGCDEEFAGDGYPKKPFPNGWKGENGLYTVGFTRKGMLGAAMDASRIAEDVALQWKAEEARAERSHFS